MESQNLNNANDFFNQSKHCLTKTKLIEFIRKIYHFSSIYFLFSIFYFILETIGSVAGYFPFFALLGTSIGSRGRYLGFLPFAGRNTYLHKYSATLRFEIGS